MTRNSLFQGWKRNHCQPSKPLGTWTRQAKEAYLPEDDEDDEDK